MEFSRSHRGAECSVRSADKIYCQCNFSVCFIFNAIGFIYNFPFHRPPPLLFLARTGEVHCFWMVVIKRYIHNGLFSDLNPWKTRRGFDRTGAHGSKKSIKSDFFFQEQHKCYKSATYLSRFSSFPSAFVISKRKEVFLALLWIVLSDF